MHLVRRAPHPRVRFVSVIIVALVALSGARALAETNEFAFLIKNGKKFVTIVDKNKQEVSTSSGLMFPITDGSVLPQSQGQARITTWKRRVTDSFFSSLGSFAALIVFEFDAPTSLRAHLTQIQTPTGLLTAIAIRRLEGSQTPPELGRSIYGTWVVSQTPVAGQGPDDLVIEGRVTINEFQEAASQLLTLTKRARQSLTSDATPVATHLVSNGAGITGAVGSFYGQTRLGGPLLPVRGFISNLAPAFWGHLLAIPTSPADFVIVSCSANGVAGPVDPTCLLSGIGPQAGRMNGTASYIVGKNATLLNVQPSFVLP